MYVKIPVNYSLRNQDQQILCLNQIYVKKLLGKSIGVIKTVLVGLNIYLTRLKTFLFTNC